MAKKKRVTKNRSATQEGSIERAPKAATGKTTPNNTPYIVIIGALLVVIAYLLSGGGGNQGAAPTGTAPNPSDFIEPVLYTGNIPEPDLKPEFAGFFPENISGMRRVKLLMDPLSDETPVERQFASQVVDRASVLYISDSVQTDFEIEYSVYKMNSPEAASQVLNFYTTETNWNNVQKQFGNTTFWIWQGFLEGSGRPYGMYFYWDSLNDGTYLPLERTGSYYIAQSSAELLCLHGETAVDEYFIMVDVHAPFESVNGLSDQMFAEAAAQIDAL